MVDYSKDPPPRPRVRDRMLDVGLTLGLAGVFVVFQAYTWVLKRTDRLAEEPPQHLFGYANEEETDD